MTLPDVPLMTIIPITDAGKYSQTADLLIGDFYQDFVVKGGYRYYIADTLYSGRFFTTYEDAQAYLYPHPQIYQCPYCDLFFSSQAELDAHIARVHGKEEKPAPTTNIIFPLLLLLGGGILVVSLFGKKRRRKKS
jgi:hypothetical protein